MKKSQLLEEFKTILAEHISAEESDALKNLNEQSDLRSDLGIDSLDVVNIVIDIENYYDIEIENEQIKSMSTVGSCINLIHEKLLLRA